MSNRLRDAASPYLLQHAENPVDWFPWGEEAFAKAKAEDKPIFLSIGYSTCHWCHVMAHESFEDEDVAALLNRWFVAVKVDREERPDIDSLYMSVCQAFTGGGGWPMSIFITADKKPFFAGTYFPKDGRRGAVGLKELLTVIHEKWSSDKAQLLRTADEVLDALRERPASEANADESLLRDAVRTLKRNFDERCGGFGNAPKFPTPHTLLFLMQQYQKEKDEDCLRMAETTLVQMYKGGLFDHIGGGFSRYSTDRKFLVPHFEKMLYDNALLLLAYCKAYQITQKPLYRQIGEKIAKYVLREMTAPEGGFYSAQDADSDGEEGKYYVFAPDEIVSVLGKDEGETFNRHFDITPEGNFEGKSIPNLLKHDQIGEMGDEVLQKVYAYRRGRTKLHLDDKILTAWNALMIAGLSQLYRVTQNTLYLDAAEKAQRFIEENLGTDGELYVSWRNGKRGAKGFLDEYAYYVFALLHLYEATFSNAYLRTACVFCQRAIAAFADAENGGYFLSGEENEELLLRPKETYDGALPSGNSVMAYVLTRLGYLMQNDKLEQAAQKQLEFMAGAAAHYPAGHTMFLLALSDKLESPEKIIVALAEGADSKSLQVDVTSAAVLRVLEEPTDDYPLKDGKTTYYVCREHRCLPPVHDLREAMGGKREPAPVHA